MTQRKANRIVAAVTVNVILLIAVLVAVVIYQMVEISVISKKRAELRDKIEYYNQQIEEGQDDLEYLKSEQYLRDLALQYGYVYSNN